jgi:hypothetical protein
VSVAISFFSSSVTRAGLPASARVDGHVAELDFRGVQRHRRRRTLERDIDRFAATKRRPFQVGANQRV